MEKKDQSTKDAQSPPCPQATMNGLTEAPECNHEDESDSINEYQDCLGSEGKTEQPKPMIPAAALILVAAITLELTLFWPQITRALTNIGEPRERTFLGTVQQVSFIGGFGPSTQINTQSQTLLVRGTATVQRGDRLERRKWRGDPEACDLRTGACWVLINE